MEDRELTIRQTVILEQIVKKVDEIERKVNGLNDVYVMKTESRLAVLEEKNGRLEKIVYGFIALVLTQGISLIILWLKK